MCNTRTYIRTYILESLDPWNSTTSFILMETTHLGLVLSYQLRHMEPTLHMSYTRYCYAILAIINS